MTFETDRNGAIEPTGDSECSHPAQAPAEAWDDEVDNELQAAIEYKIAIAGVAGAEKVLELLNGALRRCVS